MKKYISKSNISINVVLSSGANRHISFSSQSNGSSVFYTSDPEIMEAMERHYKFGTLFRIDPRYVSDKPRSFHSKTSSMEKTISAIAATATSEPTADEPKTSSTEEHSESSGEEHSECSGECEPHPISEDIESPASAELSESERERLDEESGLKKIVISDPDSAKTYLAEHFGLSRTKLKGLKSIKSAAEANGIEFVGLD